MAEVTPYLFFTDMCREAMEFYRSCFGGDLHVMTYGEAQGPGCPLAQKDKVMHASLVAGGVRIMASDDPQGPVTVGTNVQVSVHCESLEEIERLYAAVGAGGKPTYPLHDAPWGDRFGVLTDRYGVHWMFNFSRAG